MCYNSNKKKLKMGYYFWYGTVAPTILTPACNMNSRKNKNPKTLLSYTQALKSEQNLANSRRNLK